MRRPVFIFLDIFLRGMVENAVQGRYDSFELQLGIRVIVSILFCQLGQALNECKCQNVRLMSVW